MLVVFVEVGDGVVLDVDVEFVRIDRFVCFFFFCE